MLDRFEFVNEKSVEERKEKELLKTKVVFSWHRGNLVSSFDCVLVAIR